MRAVWIMLAFLLAGCHSGLESRPGYWVNTQHPAYGSRPRVKTIVIHYTAEEFPDSLATLSGRDVSVHYLIPERPPHQGGKMVVWQLVPEDRLAWHAGISAWRGATRLNDTSIGIELVNQGYVRTLTGLRWQPYPAAQLAVLTSLLNDLVQRYAIAPENIVGHSDIAPQRKQDPGPLFPWQQLAGQGLGAWPDAKRVSDYLAGRAATTPVPMAELLPVLADYGYNVSEASSPRQQQKLVAAFQMHFRQADYRGVPDAETLAIARALRDKYGTQR